jgi:ribosomal protein S18 acetylase RimI-like enzyme
MKTGRGHKAAVEIRRAGGEDSEAILACLALAFEGYCGRYTRDGFLDTVLDSESLELRMRDMCVLVAISEEKVVGTIGFGVSGKTGHLRGMAVLPNWQGTGVASALLRAAEDGLLESGCTLVTLDTTGPLQRATSFYEKHGFSKTGRISDFFGMALYEYSKQLSKSPL